MAGHWAAYIHLLTDVDDKCKQAKKKREGENEVDGWTMENEMSGGEAREEEKTGGGEGAVAEVMFG